MEHNNHNMNWIKSTLKDISSKTTIIEVEQILYSILNQLKSKPESTSEAVEELFHPKTSQFLNLVQAYSKNEAFLQYALQCIDDILNCDILDVPITGKQLEAYEAIGDVVQNVHYTFVASVTNLANPASIQLLSISILSRIAKRSPNFAQLYISELLGIAKANINFGLKTVNTKPQKIVPTQAVYCDSSADELDGALEADLKEHWNGGKVSKKRKPRALAKSMQNPQQNYQQQYRNNALDLGEIITFGTNDIKTSDSDASEAELSGYDNAYYRQYNAHERQKHAKVRNAAIGLLGIVVLRVQERRLLYAYWHAFFDNSKLQNSNDQHQRDRSDLLYVGQRDPNARCRALALQVAAQLIFGSKNFLQRAECATERCPTTFLPFGYSLGLQVISLFEQLTQILAKESSLPVITQALKCLAVLVQATTPFKRFEPRNFVAPFVKEVQRLIQHRDATIQVAALMVIEFLIATPDITPEIPTAIGFLYNSRSHTKETKRLKDENAADLLELDNTFEEFVESDSDDNMEIQNVEPKDILNNTEKEVIGNKTSFQSAWILQNLFQNLSKATTSMISVRIESFQLLSALAQHFTFLQSHLECVANCIENSLDANQQSDLRICAARCLDTIAYQIGRKLLENSPTTTSTNTGGSELLEQCARFWSQMLPVVMNYISISGPESVTSMKVCLCDALSNIGVIVFVRLPNAQQMNLIGFLSGIASAPNEEVVVRSAAVRALAVYALFPSLQENLVFVENAAELALRLVNVTNVLVRVKALWALGNISDALLLNISNCDVAISMPERISDDLLWRLIVAATEACSDNDKVRCNAVRTLGNLLRLLNGSHFNMNCVQNKNNRICFNHAINKLNDCLRGAGSAKVKWNTCYAIGNLLQNSALFNISPADFEWQSKLYPTLANVIVHHPNFKVRINAATALTHIKVRAHFGNYFEKLWTSLVDAIEQSHHLDNFYEYNHRDHLQEQLCLAMTFLLRCALPEDFNMLRSQLEPRVDVIRSTWIRVVNRMVPEKSAPIVACTAFLQQQWKSKNLNSDQRNNFNFIINVFQIQ